MADMRVVGEAALHHVPAEQPLQPAEQKHQPQARRQRARQHAPPQKKQKRQQKDEGDGAAEHAVRVFHQKDEAKPGERHVRIDQLEFRVLPVFFKRELPRLRAERRHRAGQRPPFHHGQTGAAQAHRPAERDQREHQQAAEQEPGRERIFRERPRRARQLHPRQRLKISELLAPPKPKLLLIATSKSASRRSVAMEKPAAAGSRFSMLAEPAMKPDSIISSV